MSSTKMREENDRITEPAPGEDEPTAKPAGEEIGALEALWSFFSSMKTAIALLLILAAASIAGTILEDKTGYSIYGKPWFSLLLVLVGVNLLVCSINRLGLVWRRTFHPDVAVTPERVEGMTRAEKLSCSGAPQSAVETVSRALRAGSYAVATETNGEGTSLYAAKGRAGLWGPHLTHISLLVIFAGAVYGNMAGTDGFTAIVEGKRADTYNKQVNNRVTEQKIPLGFEVGLRNFTIKYDKNHNPVGYKSDVQVYDNGKPAVHKVVDVNHPLTYKGLSFYQASYGLVGLVVKVTAPNGKVARIPYNINTEDGPQGRTYSIADEPFRQFPLGGKNLTLFVHDLVPDYVGGERVGRSPLPLNPAVNVMISDRFPKEKSLDAWKQLGWMTASKSAPFKGFTVTLERVVSYTGLQVSRNPGLPIVYVGFGLMVLGVILSFYVTHKVIRVSVTPGRNGARVVMGATSRADMSFFDKDFQRVRDALAPASQGLRRAEVEK